MSTSPPISYAFESCKNLESIAIPDSIESIGDKAFTSTAWYDSQPDGLVYAGKVLYKHKGTVAENTSIVIPDGTKGIAGEAFLYCTGLTGVTIPDSVTSVGYAAFMQCEKLAGVSIGKNVEAIEGRTFFGCTSLKSVTIPDKVGYIGGSAFYGCTALESVNIPGSVTAIYDEAFFGCTALKSITIPESVTELEYHCVGYHRYYSINETIPDFTIRGKKGSAAEAYAEQNHIDFVDSSVVEVSSLKLDKTTATITAGKTVTLAATITPANATNKTLTWATSNSSVATVSNGTVKAIKAGTAVITAATVNGKKATCKVTVKKK